MTTSGDDKLPAIEPIEDGGIRLYVNVHPRVFILPTVGAFLGLGGGMIQGARAEQLRFLAENAHNPPRTVQGWYFYNKTKNYRMMWRGLRQGAKTAAKVGSFGLLWGGIEEVVLRFAPSMEPAKELIAGTSSSVLFAAVSRLNLHGSGRIVLLGSLMGGVMSLARKAQEKVGDKIKQARTP